MSLSLEEERRLRVGATVPQDRPLRRRCIGYLIGFFKPPYLWMVIYSLCYLAGFLFIERAVHPNHYFLIHSPIDDLIPFCEYFAIPYLLWFFYWIGALLYFGVRRMAGGDCGDFFLLSWTLAIGMTTFIITSLVFPNEINLRPDVLPRENFFTWACTMIWANDTPTNVLPSIHVFNSIATHVAVRRCKTIRFHNAVKYSSFVLCVLIIVGTLFIKQHSIVDIVTAVILYIIVYAIVYRSPFTKFVRGKEFAQRQAELA